MLELKSLLKIKSAIRASYAKNKVATVIHSGDDDNGSILLKIRRKDSKACLMAKSLSNHYLMMVLTRGVYCLDVKMNGKKKILLMKKFIRN